MSTIDSHDLETTGYFLPEDSQLRLKKLREHVEFLANLARPRMADEAEEMFAEIRPGDVSICLEMLEEQIAQVLDEISWPAELGESDDVCEDDTESEAASTEAATQDDAEPVMVDADDHHLFGITLDQIDEINLLLESLRAHGHMVTVSEHTELSDVTLASMGDAIVRDTQKLHDIIDHIYEEQRLKPPHGKQTGVREERATYLPLPARLSPGGALYVMRGHPTYQ